MQLVCFIKIYIQKLREDSWQNLLKGVILFCEQHDIDIPNFNSTYVVDDGCTKKNHVTIKHHFKVNIFFVVVDKQFQN